MKDWEESRQTSLD